ncbi:FtsX-like permease family protein [Parvibaculaceae bacterium PLY_AMNH_Bact1]|nr:FtsX-like permease family protein [Parvibaculaceae bacterium PLY_AMNH_Bact1]
MIPLSLGRLAAANLFRHPTRTLLSFTSLAIAFLLFMLLNAITAAFSSGPSEGAVNRLVVDAKYSMTDNLPVTYLQQIRALDGVDNAASVNWFGGYYRDPKETFTTLAVNPVEYFEILSDYDIAPEALARFEATRAGAVVSTSLAEKYGWRIGDRITLRGNIWPMENGSWDWEFEIAGTFNGNASQLSDTLFLLRQDHFDDAVASWAKNQVGFILLTVAKGHKPEDIANAIDKLYENSSDPTRTASEDQYARQFVSQLGDIGLMSTAILSAVFFTILLLTGNTASQTFRERVPELAAMKTLGFTDASVAALVLGEAVVLCVAGGACGISVALFLEPALNDSIGAVLGGLEMNLVSALLGLALAAGIGLLIGIQPAWSAKRLSIADALRD